MIIAELQITSGSGLVTSGFVHRVRFDNLETAFKTYYELAELLRKRGDLGNDLPRTVDIQGVESSLSLPLANIQSVGIMDLAKSNEQEQGMRETFPNLYLK